MRLRAHHVSSLSPLERKVYAPLIGSIDYDGERREKFIAQSEKYVEGDESVLPYPERSRRGIMLLSLCQQLESAEAAAVFAPTVARNAKYVKEKLLASGTSRAYVIKPVELAAALYGRGRSPFTFFRNKPDFHVPNLGTASHNLICALQPEVSRVTQCSEYDIVGLLLRQPRTASGIADTPYFTQAARAGLLQVTELDADRFWLTRDGEDAIKTSGTREGGTLGDGIVKGDSSQS